MCHRRNHTFPAAGAAGTDGPGVAAQERAQGPACGMVWFRPYGADAADPRIRAAGALRLLGPAALAGAAIVAFAPWASWMIFAVGWMLVPAVGQFVGAAGDLGRRALVHPSPVSWDGSGSGSDIAAAEPAALLGRFRGAAERLPAGAARDGGTTVADAASRLLAAAEPGAPERTRLLVPAADLLADYARLAAAAPPDDATLASVAADFPRLAAKLDERAAALTRCGASGPVADA